MEKNKKNALHIIHLMIFNGKNKYTRMEWDWNQTWAKENPIMKVELNKENCWFVNVGTINRFW